jgi:pyruvate/2-oxoglutarate dehydrogenase complex dihydrolipoamide acyltransferase (E2) component
MPRLADTLVEGTVARWLTQVGATVQVGDPIAAIETDKVTTELTAPNAGTVLELIAPEGRPVPVDSVIARIGGGELSPASEAPTTREPSSGSQTAGPLESPAAMKPTPVAARLLAEHGLSARQVQTRGRRLTKQDVLRHVDGHSRPPTEPLSAMRKAIAEHMLRAKTTIPHGQTIMEVDVTEVADRREQEKEAFRQRERANLTYTVLFVRALAHALSDAERPVDIGVAVALDAGLIVPVLRGVDRLSLGDIARAVDDLAGRARTGKLALEETQGALMTVTNVGSFGNLLASPIVPLGQMGILGPGLVERRPLAGPNQSIRPGWRCLVTLMFDRRALDDFAADRLLRRVLDHVRL